MHELREPGRAEQPSPLSAWADAAVAGTTAWAAWSMAAAGLGMSLWTNALGQQRDPTAMSGSSGYPLARSGRSWYRPPADPFYDLTAWLPGLRASHTAFDWWRAGTGLPSAWPAPGIGSLDMLAAWMTAMAAFSLPLTARLAGTSLTPAQQWAQLAFAWPFAQPPRAEAMPLPFAAYRSDSGHATAQIMFPKIVVAATVWPFPGFPFWSLM